MLYGRKEAEQRDEKSGIHLDRSHLPEATLGKEEALSYNGETYQLRHFELGFLQGVLLRNGTPPEKAVAVAVRNETERSDLVERLRENPDIARQITSDPRYQGSHVTLYNLVGDNPELFRQSPDTMTFYCRGGLLDLGNQEDIVAYGGGIYNATTGAKLVTITQPDPDKVLKAFGIRVLSKPEYEALRLNRNQFRNLRLAKVLEE